MSTKWLVEYVGARPLPVYVPADYKLTHGNYTMDAWAARQFDTKAEAEAFMVNPDGCLGYGAPWAAIEHSFMES